MAERIASLLPSATEIVCALGLAERLVGVSHECDYPPEIAGRAVLTEPKLDPRGTSREIDSAVQLLVRDGLSVYRIRERALAEVRPDLIVTQQHCEVCAVSFDEVRKATARVLDGPVEIVSLQPNRLDDVFEDFMRVARTAGVETAGARLVADSRERLARLRERLAGARSRPRVACIEWLDPLMAAGNWVPELVQLAGGEYELAATGASSRSIAWDDLTAYAPDVVILMPCGFSLEQTRREVAAFTATPEWQALPAVRRRRAYSVDGNAYLNRPGPRLVDSAELLAGLIQPGYCASLIPPGSWEPVPATGA